MYEVELSKQENIEQWSTFIMSSKEVIEDPPVVVHTSVKGMTVTSPQLSAIHSSSSQSIFQPVLKQATQNVVDLSTETSARDNIIPTIRILSFAIDATSLFLSIVVYSSTCI